MQQAYLTIDDSPSSQSTRLIDGLVARGVPALLFCRGDLLEANPAPMIAAVQKGMVLGNHGYIHKRAGDLSFEELCDSILHTDKLIDDCYAQAGETRPGKYFRFPYIDRGDGDLVERRFFDIIAAVERGEALATPTSDRVTRVQNFLAGQGFTQPFHNVTHPLYAVPWIREAKDSLFTYSTGDWMLNARHRGTQPMSSLDDLTAAMESDPYLMTGKGAQIILIHDHDELTDIVLGLVDSMLDKDFLFQEY